VAFIEAFSCVPIVICSSSLQLGQYVVLLKTLFRLIFC